MSGVVGFVEVLTEGRGEGSVEGQDEHASWEGVEGVGGGCLIHLHLSFSGKNNIHSSEPDPFLHNRSDDEYFSFALALALSGIGDVILRGR